MPDEQDLLALKFHHGDEKAWKEIYDHFYSGLYVFSYEMTRDSEESKEIISDVFNILFSKHKHFQNMRDIKGFLFVSVRNACLSYLKRRKWLKEKMNQMNFNIPSPSFEHHLVETELLANLNKSMEQLPSRCREIIRMQYFEKKGYKEIAENLNISTETVKSQRKYALDKLRKALGVAEVVTAISLIFFMVIG